MISINRALSATMFAVRSDKDSHDHRCSSKIRLHARGQRNTERKRGLRHFQSISLRDNLILFGSRRGGNVRFIDP